MRLITAARAGATALALTIVLTACGSNSDSPSAADNKAGPDYAAAERTDGPLATRIKMYKSTAELVRDSVLVVAATGTGKVTRDQAEGPGDPLAITTATITKVMTGKGYKVGDEIPIFVEGFHDENGQLGQRKIEADKSYVLYLAPFRTTPDGQIFVVTGYLAGIYEEVAPNHYGRVDPESPSLPRGLDLSGAEVREVP